MLVVGLALSTVTGCKRVARLIGEKTAQQVEEATAGVELGGDDGAAAMGSYATGFNTLIDDPKECLTEYFDDVPLEGPQEGKSYRFFPAHTRGIIELGKAKEVFTAAKAGAPDELASLAPLADASVKALDEACATFSDIHKYYEAEDFKDDGGMRGQELHTKMVKIAESAEKDLKAFEDALSQVEDRHSQAEIAAYEKDKSYGYWFRHYNFEAKKLLGASQPTAYSPKFQALESAYQGLTNFSKDKAESIHASFKAYMGQADRYHSIAKKLSRSLAEAEPDAQEVARQRDQLTDAYNSLVSVGNSLRELEGHDLLK